MKNIPIGKIVLRSVLTNNWIKLSKRIATSKNIIFKKGINEMYG